MKNIFMFLKKNILFIIVLLIFTLFNIKLPYYIDYKGGLINIEDRYIIDNSYSSKGSINMTYVSEYKATIPLYLIAKINKDMEIVKKDNVVYNNETEEDCNLRGKIMMNEANLNAVIVAYKKADKKYLIKEKKIIVTYINNDARTNLKIGDEIISINNININSKEEISKIINNKKENDQIKIIVKNKGKYINKYAYVLKENIIGILVNYKMDIETFPNIKIVNKKGEYGPSGGLMNALQIYNKLIEDDITKGYKISGTGTIDIEGNVGKIDGIKHKLKGALKADIFMVPKENYEEAIKLKKKNNYKIKIVKVNTFDDAINYLKSL